MKLAIPEWLKFGSRQEPSPTPSAEPVPVSQPTPEPTPSPHFRAQNTPTKIAKQHAYALLRHLINSLNDARASNRSFTVEEVKSRYSHLCNSTQVTERHWNTVAKHLNLLLRKHDEPLKPYKELINPVTGEVEKRRVYEIPVAMPTDWQERIGYRVAHDQKPPAQKRAEGSDYRDLRAGVA